MLCLSYTKACKIILQLYANSFENIRLEHFSKKIKIIKYDPGRVKKTEQTIKEKFF